MPPIWDFLGTDPLIQIGSSLIATPKSHLLLYKHITRYW